MIIFLIGIGISWLSILCFQHDPFPIDQIRILGVMQRLALGYGVTAIVALLMKHKYIPYLIAVLLISYFAILALGNGYVYDETNILSIVDRAVLGQAQTFVPDRYYPYFRRFLTELWFPYLQESMVSFLRTRNLRSGFQFSGITRMDH